MKKDKNIEGSKIGFLGKKQKRLVCLYPPFSNPGHLMQDIQLSIELQVDLMKDIVAGKPVREKILNEMLMPRREET